MAKKFKPAVLEAVFGPEHDEKNNSSKELTNQQPSSQKRFKLSALESVFDTNYLDMLSATGKMDAENKTAYDAKRKSEGADPTLNYTAKAAEKLAQQKQKELDSYKSSEEYKAKTPYFAPTADAGQFGSYIGNILSNLIQTGNWKGDSKVGQIQAEGDYLQGIADKAKNESVILKDMASYEKWPEEDKKDLERYLKYTGNGITGGGLITVFTGAEAGRNRLEDKYGKETVRNVIESLSRKLNAENAEAAQKEGQKNASLLESILSVPVSVAGSVTATSDYLTSILRDVTGVSSGRFSGIDPNTPGAMPMIYAEAVRQGEAENVKDWAKATAEIHGADEKTQKAVGAVASTVYTAGMGALDNLTRVYATGGVGALALAATGSFSSAVRQATLNGASAQQAAAFGFVSAASEILTEKLPLDNLLDNLASAGSGADVLSILTGAAKQAGIELTTEELNLVAGIAAEALILRESSDYRKKIAEMVAQGMSYEDATKAANEDLVAQAGQTALQSGLSGFMTSAGTSAVTQMTGANRFTEAAQEYDRQKETAAETAQRLSELLNIKQKAQTEKGVESQQTAEGGKLEINELVDEVIAKNTGAPADPVGAAVESFTSTGTVSNKQATDILNSVKAVQQLVQETGVKLDGLTMAQRRNAVKTAVEQMAQKNVQEESTSVNTDPAQHTPQEQAVIDEYQSAVDDNLVEYIQTVKDNPGQKMPRYPLKDVSDRAAADIKRLTGIAVDGNKTQLESRIVEHIIKDHGENGSADHSMRDLNDIARIQYVIDNYDSIEHGGTSSAYVYQNQHGRNANAQTVIMKKKVNGTYFVVEAVPDTKKKTVFITSAYMSKDGTQKPAESLSGDAEAPRFTSENATKNTADLIGAIAPSTIIPNDSETVNAENGAVGAAEYNFSRKAQYQDLLYEGNVQRDREGDVRPMEVPKTDPYGRNVSEFVGNAYGAEITPDKMAGTIEKLVQEGALGFDRRSNQEALNEAAGEIEEKGMARIRNQITRNVANGKLQDGDIEKALLLYSMYANKKGDQAQDNAAEMFVDLTTMAHMSGRNLQLFGLLRKLTPEGQASTIKKMVQKNVENMVRSGRVKKGYETEVDPDLLKEYQEAARENMRAVSDEQKQETQERMQKIQQAIFTAEAAKMPATFKAKWDAWRYMAMLGNAKTQIRNMGGNLLFMPYKAAKDKMAAVFEKALPKEQRTKAIGTDRELLAWAKNDAKTTDIHNALLYSAKLGDDAASAQFAENRKVFDSKALDAVRKFVEKVPQEGDMLFKNGYYARSLASFLKSRGYKASDIQNGNISAAVLSEARGYAIQEAMKATFNDCNAFSDAVASIGRKKTDNIWGKALNVAAEGILPFRRTPANIAVRFAEYSPAGLVKGVWDMATKVRSGDLSASAAIDQIAAGLTGSGVMALGFLLAKGIAGVKITGSGTDEDEKRHGHQDYAVEFSVNGQEYSYKIDWAAPANLPLFVGANIYKAMEEAGADTDVSTFTAILHGMGTMFEPMLALSCMSSLNDLVEGIRYAPEGEALYSAVADIATSYFLQGVPALLRQAYQASQVNKQTTFANSDDPTIRDLQKLGAQIPFVGAAFQTDKVNAWGETETTESGLQRVANAFLNPGTVKQIERSEVEQEITRLNSSQDKNVSPLSAEKTVTYTDKDGRHHKNERLTEEQYNAIAKKQGAAQRELVENLIVSEDYKALRDAEKAAVISSAYTFARETARAETLDGYEPSANWLKEAKGNEVQYIINKTVSDSLNDAFGNDSDQALDAAYDVYMKLGANARAKITEDASGRVKYFLTAKQNGISTDTFRELYKTYDALYDNDGLKASAKASQWSYALEKAQEQGTITSSQKAALKEEMNFWQMIPAETSRFDALTENGLSADKASYVDELLDSILPPAGKSGVTQQQKVQAVTSADSRLSDKEQQQVLKEVLSESAYGKYLEILELGYSNDDYSDSYRIYATEKDIGGKGTKARTIEAFRKEFGISEAAATALYEIYNPK